MKQLKREDLDGFGSLITIRKTNTCLGDLICFLGHGTYEPQYGKVDISEEEVEAHNKALDKAIVEGLDQRCEVGQGGYAYLSTMLEAPGLRVAKTFHGTLLAAAVVKGKTVTFTRKNKTFRGRILSKDSDCFNFRRIK